MKWRVEEINQLKWKVEDEICKRRQVDVLYQKDTQNWWSNEREIYFLPDILNTAKRAIFDNKNDEEIVKIILKEIQMNKNGQKIIERRRACDFY